LSSHFIHPTAEQVYDALKNELPTLSRTTVYNTLKTFLNAGLIKELTIEENEVRYEFNLHDHGHFKCKKCGRIFDFNYSMKLPSDELKGFCVTDVNIFITGVCRDCLDSDRINMKG